METISLILWGPFTVALLLVCGGYHSCRSEAIQLRFPRLLKGKSRGRRKAVMSALAASMGTGNITGCAAAIAVGGAGAVFWMWVSALLGMGLAYSENRLGAAYSEKFPEKSASPMLYMTKGLKAEKTAHIYAFACLCAAFSMGCMSQISALGDALSEEGLISKEASAIACSFLLATVIFSSKKAADAAMDAADRLVPIMGLLYGAGCLVLIIKSGTSLPLVFSDIIKQAFSLKAAGGGVTGTVMAKAVSVGLRRGIFSNEAGMGSSVLVHSEAKFSSPENAGAWAAFEVFLDTIVCCTITALALLSSKETSLTSAFENAFGKAGGIFVCLCICLFAFASALGWCCCGEKCLFYLTKGRFGRAYKTAYCAAAVVSGLFSTNALFDFSDIVNVFLIFPNVIAVTALVIKEQLPRQ